MTFILYIIVPMIIGFWAQHRVSKAYQKNMRIRARSGITGAEAASYVMRNAGITDVEIVSTPGTLTDHYDPSKKQLVLSEPNYHGDSLAAVGVAAHEAGHAIQHKVGYSMLELRMSLVPITSIASKALPFIIIGGFLFSMFGLIKLGVIAYLILTFFSLVTLPVEFDASKRAKAELAGLGIIDADELPGVKETLDAAAWTYIAAFVASLGNLLHLLSIVQNNDD